MIEEVSYEDGEALVQYGTLTFEFGAPIDSQDPGNIQPIISALQKPSFQKSGFDPMPQRLANPHFGTPSTPRVRQVVRCTVIQTVSWGGVGCGVAALLSGGAFSLPCAGGAAAASFTSCTLTAIFG